MRRNLTELVITRTKPPASGQLDVFDAVQPGFGLRIGVKGTRTFFLIYRTADRRQKRVTIGDAKVISLADARKKADATLSMVRGEVDTELKFKEAVDNFLRHCVADGLRPRTVSNRKSMLAEASEQWGDRSVAMITDRDVLAYVDRIIDRGARITANRHFEALRAMFNWLVKRRVIAQSPCDKLERPAKERSRERWLDEDEIRLFWLGCEKVGPTFRDIFRLLLLTAQRHSEVGLMRWQEVDLDKRVWTIPGERTKNGKTHDVALADLAVAILGARKRGGDFVFPSVRPNKKNAGKTAASGYSKAKSKLDAAMGEVKPWLLHDLRRTVTWQMADLGVPPHVADKVLNHQAGTISGVAATYNRFAYKAEQREALLKWEARLRTLTKV